MSLIDIMERPGTSKARLDPNCSTHILAKSKSRNIIRLRKIKDKTPVKSDLLAGSF